MTFSLATVRRIQAFRADCLSLFAEVGRFEQGVFEIDFGVKTAFVVSDPRCATGVLTSSAFGKGTRPYGPLGTFAGFGALRSLVGPSLPALDGDAGRIRRRQVQPVYHALAARMSRAFADAPPITFADAPGGPVDLYPIISAAVFERFCLAMFGRPYADDAAAIGRAVSVATTCLDRLAKTVIPLGSVLDPSAFRLRRCRRVLLEFAQRVYADLREAAKPRPPICALFDADLDEARLVDEIVTQIAAGTETSTLTACWAMTELARNPENRDAMRHAPDRATARAHATRCIRETMRLYPAFWTLIRIAEDDAVVEGHRFTRGDLLFVTPYGVHRNPRFWPDPDRFDPDRFIDRTATRGDYMPFGYGPRACLGGRLAQTLVTDVILAACQDLDWTLGPVEPVIDPRLAVLKSRTGFPFELARRTESAP